MLKRGRGRAARRGRRPLEMKGQFLPTARNRTHFSDKVDQFPQKKTRFPFLAKTGSENKHSVRYRHRNPGIKGTLKKTCCGSPLGYPFGVVLEPFWAPFGASWALLGPLGALLELLWSPFGLLLAPLGSHNLVFCDFSVHRFLQTLHAV